MGMSAFNRARRSRLDVEEEEAKRFEKWHKDHWGAERLTDKDPDKTDKEVEKIRKLEGAASDLIGEKARQGILEGERGGIIDRPLREDHAAEIAGRTQVDGQGEPTSPVDRVRQRIADGSANEELVSHTQVDQPGAPAELIRDATLEVTPPDDRAAKERELDAMVASAEVDRAAVQAEKDAREETAAAKAEGDAARARGEVAPVQAEAQAGAGQVVMDMINDHNASTDAPSAEEQADAEAERVRQQRLAALEGSGTGDAADALAKNAEAQAAQDATERKLPAAGKSAGAGKEPSKSAKAAGKQGTAKK